MKKFYSILGASLLALTTSAEETAEVKTSGKCYGLAFSSGDETSAY